MIGSILLRRALAGLAIIATVPLAAHAGSQELDRTRLPIPMPKRPEIDVVDVRDAKMPPQFRVTAPDGAPNVVIVLIDDVGFGAASSFGGPVPTPTLDALAQDGLRYNNFHTTALCSPTRAALKAGRNHHTVNMGFITEMATGFPGATGQIPSSTASIAEMLRLNGYSTSAFGKWHETAAWEASISGPLFNEYTYFNGVHETVPDLLKKMNEWGGPKTYPHMAAGWAVALDAPFGWMKQVASDFGGTRNGLVVHWPKGIRAKNEIRTQFGHVIDVAPTILEAAGLPEPTEVDGVKQIPIEGTSLVYSFNDAAAKERHTTQYFEIAGNRGIYHDGWFARTLHRAPWEPKPRTTFAKDKWELFDVRSDFSLAHDLSAQNPKKVAEMEKLFLKEAEAHHVLPLDDRMFERAIADEVGRPDLMRGRDTLTLAGGMTGMSENVFLDVKNKSVTITANVDVPKGGAHGTILAQGGRFGGWSLYVNKNGRPAYDYNFLGMSRTSITTASALTPGKSTIRFQFDYDGGGPGKGGNATIFVNDKLAGKGRIERTEPAIFSADETADVGIDLGTPVVESIGSEEASRFNGGIPQVTVEARPAGKANAAK